MEYKSTFLSFKDKLCHLFDQESSTTEIDKIKLFENWVRSVFLLRRALLSMRAYKKRPFYSKLSIVILVAIIYYRI